jgi:hypothetical protein
MQLAFKNGEVTLREIRQRLMSWQGHVMHADASGLCYDLLSTTIFTRQPTVG